LTYFRKGNRIAGSLPAQNHDSAQELVLSTLRRLAIHLNSK
jgi:hypothetical protein